MKRNISLLKLVLTVLAGILLAGACQKETSGEKTIFKAEYKESDFPDLIPAEGGKYSLTFVYKETKSMELNTKVLPWKCRLNIGEAYTDPVDGTWTDGIVTVEVPANLTAEELPVNVELSIDFGPWETVYTGKQAASQFDYSQSVPNFADIIPERISCNGAVYTVPVKRSVVTKADDQAIFLPWRYRLSGETTGSAVGPFLEEDTEVEIEFAPNYTDKDLELTLEVSYSDVASLWIPVAKFTQNAGFISEAGLLWARGNLTLSEDKTAFVIADNLEDAGLLFAPGSIYGIPAGENYAGKAYKPEETAIAIGEIPSGDFTQDPCSLVSGDFRLPTYAELAALAENAYRKIERNDVAGWAYNTSALFFPLAGTVDSETGAFTGGGMSYAGNGSDLDGWVLKYVYTTIDMGSGPQEYMAVSEFDSYNFSSVRCVRNTELPTYVSHTPEEAVSASFDLSVTTNPGDFDSYEVCIMTEGSGPVGTTVVTAADPVATIEVPANEGRAGLEDVQWTIFVNHVNTGVSFTQPAISDYVFFDGLGVAPESAITGDTSVSYESFILTVKCTSDKVSFPVEVAFSDGTASLTGAGSAESPNVTFEVPANESQEARTLTISVDGEKVAEITQEGAPAPATTFSVTWAPGNLTVKDGAFVNAEPKQHGLFFKWKSTYGVKLSDPITSSSAFAGVAYGPEEKSFDAYADIPAEGVDPCGKVAPEGTWRMPTLSEIRELIVADIAEKGKDGDVNWLKFTDGEQEVYIPDGGQLKAAGNGVALPTTFLFWTSDEDPDAAGKAVYFMISSSKTTTVDASTETGYIKGYASMLQPSNAAYQVRCVKSK